MHVCGVTAWHKWHFPGFFFKYICLFFTFRVHFTSVCLHYTHFDYKLSLSGSNTYTVFCFIPLALEVLFHTTTNDSTSNLHFAFSKSCCETDMWRLSSAVFQIYFVIVYALVLALVSVRQHWRGVWALEMFLNLCPVKLLLMCMMCFQTACCVTFSRHVLGLNAVVVFSICCSWVCGMVGSVL